MKKILLIALCLSTHLSAGLFHDPEEAFEDFKWAGAKVLSASKGFINALRTDPVATSLFSGVVISGGRAFLSELSQPSWGESEFNSTTRESLSQLGIFYMSLTALLSHRRQKNDPTPMLERGETYAFPAGFCLFAEANFPSLAGGLNLGTASIACTCIAKYFYDKEAGQRKQEKVKKESRQKLLDSLTVEELQTALKAKQPQTILQRRSINYTDW